MREIIYLLFGCIKFLVRYIQGNRTDKLVFINLKFIDDNYCIYYILLYYTYCSYFFFFLLSTIYTIKYIIHKYLYYINIIQFLKDNSTISASGGFNTYIIFKNACTCNINLCVQIKINTHLLYIHHGFVLSGSYKKYI